MDTPQTSFSPTPAVPPVVPSHSDTTSSKHTSVWLVGGVLIVLASIVGYFLFWTNGGTVPLPDGTVVQFHTSAGSESYIVARGQPVRLSGLAGFEGLPFTIIEAVPSYLPNEQVVLAKVPAESGLVLGTLRQDGSFYPIIRDGKEKSSLAVRPDGLTLLGAFSGASSTLILLNLQASDHSVIEVGEGWGARLGSDGSFIALSSKGLIRIDASGTESAVIDRADSNIQGAISPSALIVALSNSATGQLDFFKIKSTKPAISAYLGSIFVEGSYAVGFTDDETVVLKIGDTFTVHTVPVHPQ